MNIKEKSKDEQIEDFKKMVSLAHTEDCKKCYGRGYSSFNETMGMFIPCQCLVKAERKITAQRLAAKRTYEN